MHFDPLLLQLVGATLVILGATLLTRFLRQPHVVGYLLAGLLLGPAGFEFFIEYELVERMGDIGVVLLLFFVGMETSPRLLLARWRVTILGTTIQIAASVLFMALIGHWLDWSLPLIILMGFIISLSSTAVVLTYLRERRLTQVRLGRDAVGILIAQDMAIVPMLLFISVLGGRDLSPSHLVTLGIGFVLVLGLMATMVLKPHIHLPLGGRMRRDHEMQVFVAIGLCLGFALLTGYLRLSTALGAFLAGMLVGAARETRWVRARLEPFRVVFVAVFFVSIGLLVDVDYVLANLELVTLIVLATFVGNTAINALMLRLVGEPWHYGLYAGAYLAQIGEFSFVLAAAGLNAGLLDPEAYQLVIAVIAGTLFLSPSWIALVGRIPGVAAAAQAARQEAERDRFPP